MPVTKIPFDYAFFLTAAAGSNDIVSPQVEDGFVYCIQHIAVENLTTNYTSLRLIKVVGGEEMVVAYQAPCVANVPDWYDYPIWVTEGQYGLVRLVGCTALDQLRLYISGYKQTNKAYWEVA